MNTDRRSIGCILVMMGSVATIFGVAALLGVSPIKNEIELEFFGIEMNSRGGRILWVLGSLATAGVGVALFRAKKRGD